MKAIIVWLSLAGPCWASYQDQSSDSITLRQYVDIRIAAVESARVVAYESMEKRLEGMNEFRDTLKDQASKFITRAELQPTLDDLRMLREAKASMDGKASYTSMLIAIGLGAVSAVIGVLNLIARLATKE